MYKPQLGDLFFRNLAIDSFYGFVISVSEKNFSVFYFETGKVRIFNNKEKIVGATIMQLEEAEKYKYNKPFQNIISLVKCVLEREEIIVRLNLEKNNLYLEMDKLVERC